MVFNITMLTLAVLAVEMIVLLALEIHRSWKNSSNNQPGRL